MGFLKLNELVEDIYKYLDVRMELLKLDTEEKFIKFNLFIFELVIILSMLSIFFLFSNLALAFYLNGVFASHYLGFLLIAVAQLGLLILFLIAKRVFPNIFKNWIRQTMVRLVKRVFGK
ncbi:MAG: hypothetical protein MUE85_11250 [Microscillaceae bacterium]|nr:hypothetical protein [Microscillaceae bacterium]